MFEAEGWLATCSVRSATCGMDVGVVDRVVFGFEFDEFWKARTRATSTRYGDEYQLE